MGVVDICLFVLVLMGVINLLVDVDGVVKAITDVLIEINNFIAIIMRAVDMTPPPLNLNLAILYDI